MVTATPTWAQAAMTTAREALPRLQRDLDAARVRLDERRGQLAAVERASAALDPDANPDVVVTIRVAAEVLPAMVAEAETAVTAAMTARRAARSALLPAEESPWARIAAARQADSRRQGELDGARSQVGELQRNRAAALVTVRDTPPSGDMVRLAGAEAALRMTDRALPAAQNALASAEEAAHRARREVDAMRARVHALRATVLGAEPDEAEAALVELMSLVDDAPSGWLLR
ncbi:MAG: hypothetical protein M3R02_14475 [Chloroflexota bacterium]|nr:hypothetical protein [Chloroflexota bacterium]